MPIRDNQGNFNISDYIFQPGRFYPYLTLQNCINQATTDATNAVIYVKEGQVVENLDFSSITHAVTIVGASNTLSEITGVHTLHPTIPVSFENIILSSPDYAFNEATAGSAPLLFDSCVFNMINGTLVNLPNWTGPITFENCIDNSTTNSLVNNTSTAEVYIRKSRVGNGANAMLCNNSLLIEHSEVDCPITYSGAVAANVRWSRLNGLLTNNSTGDFFIKNSRLDQIGIAQCITTGAASNTYITDSLLTPGGAIYATGAGTVFAQGLVTPNSSINGATQGTTGLFEATSANLHGYLSFSRLGYGPIIAEGANAIMGVATLVAGTINVNTTAVTANSRIFLTKQTATSSGVLRVASRVAGTSFNVSSSDAGDTDTFAWLIIQPA